MSIILDPNKASSTAFVGLGAISVVEETNGAR